MRLFTAIDLPADVRKRLDAYTAALRPAARIKWSPASNLHITTKFIGEWPEQHLDRLIARLKEVPAPGPFDMAITGTGWFPDARRPRVFYAGIQAPPELAALAGATVDACATLGIPHEDRPYSPHLTLARIKEPLSLAPLHEAIARKGPPDFGGFRATAQILFLSELRPGGSVYVPLAEFPLTRP
jgi:RNA 2',3'-cyclic 3'-phosphodiesterase